MKLRNDLRYQLRKFVETWAKKYKISVEAFSEWKINVFKKLDFKLHKIQNSPRIVESEVLKDKECLEYLQKLHSKFVLTPVDKASNNIAVTCKKFYIKTILTETGLWPCTNSLTYSQLKDHSKKEILDSQYEFNKVFNIKDNLKSSELPFMYAIPKFHKTPVKFRYIVSSSKCQIKPLAKTITKGLKLCQKQHEIWCNVLKGYTGINHFFIIDKNQPIIDRLNKLNEKSLAKSIETFDFSTLYTMIKHEDLKENLTWFIEKAFNGAYGKGKKVMSVYSQEAKWTNASKNNSTCTYDKSSFISIVNFLIENAFFEIGNVIIKQNIGIPMGTDPGPFMANAHLYKYEFEFQDLNRKTNYKLAKSLNYTFRYIDDVTPINDLGNFSKHINKIYPNDLILTKENTGSKIANVLDLNIQIFSNKFDIKVYDKTDNFTFEVFKYPSNESNIPDNILSNVYYSQTIRFLNLCNRKEHFLYAVKNLTNKCINKGASLLNLKNQIKKLFTRKNSTLLKLGINLKDILSSISETPCILNLEH